MRTTLASTDGQSFTKKTAIQLMEQHGLVQKGWTFNFNDNRTRLGVCYYDDKSIEISIFHADNSSIFAVRNTILHEIAHALLGQGYGHGSVWKKKAIEIGCDGQRCGMMKVTNKFNGVCPNCERVHTTNRRSVIACGVCCVRLNGGKFSEDFAISWKKS